VTDTLFLTGAAAAFELLIRATFLIAFAWGAAAALRAAGASAAARHMAWLLGIAALLALPLVWWLAPALRLPILPEAALAAPAAGAPSGDALPGLAAPFGAPIPGGWFGLLLLGYALGAAVLILRILVARALLRRVWRESDRATDPLWENLLSAVSLELLVSRPVELRIAAWPAMPMTWGTLAPKVLLPAEAHEWSNERRRLVLLHELAHVARRDSLSRSIASLACALYWFHPGVWFAAREMRIEQEHAADDRVLVAGGSAPAYARSLLHLATPDGAWPRPAHAASMAGMYQLERRLVSIVTPARRDRPTVVFFASSALTACLATLAVAAAIPVASSPAPADPLQPDPARTGPMTVASAERAAVAVAARAGTGAGQEATPRGMAGQSGQRQAEARARSTSESQARLSGVGASAGATEGVAPARSDRPAAANRPAPAVQPILAGGEPFTLSPAVPSAGLAERSPFRLASIEPPGASAARAAVPRALVDPPPASSRRLASWRRVHLTASWAQPALP
jgi:beta-lactamase regulating signal transducer with metallopeptidase domain